MTWLAWDVLSDAVIVIGMIGGGALLIAWLCGSFDDPRQSL